MSGTDAVVRLNLCLFGLSDAPNAPQTVVMGGQCHVASLPDARGCLPDYHPLHRLVVYRSSPVLALIQLVTIGRSTFGAVFGR
jgi:hypothetical protein